MEISASHHCTIGDTPVQDVFDRDMIFNLASVVDWQAINAKKQWQTDIDNVHRNSIQFSHDYTVDDILHMDMAGIYRKLDYNKYIPYIIK